MQNQRTQRSGQWHVVSESGQSTAVGRCPIIIGRGPGSTLQFADAMMSRQHALVFVRQGRLYLCDAASANGTLVNGIRVFERRRLMCGDVFELGTHRFSVIYVASTGGHYCAYRSVASSEVDPSQSLVA